MILSDLSQTLQKGVGSSTLKRDKDTIMKKLLTYLILIACFESFISASPCVFYNQKKASTNKINISLKSKRLQQEDTNTEIHPLNIFTLRYF